MCEVKNFDEFFANNLDIIVPSDSDNSPNSLRIKKSFFHYYIVGRDLPIEFVNNDKPIHLGADEVKKYVWGVSRRTIGYQSIDVQNCIPISQLTDLEIKFTAWRKANLGGLSDAIHELDLIKIVKAIVDKDYYTKNGDFDFRSLRTLIQMGFGSAAYEIVSSDFRITKSVESQLVEIAIESNFEILLSYLLSSGVRSDIPLYNGLAPLGYSLLIGHDSLLSVLKENGATVCSVDSYGNSNGVYSLIFDSLNKFEKKKTHIRRIDYVNAIVGPCKKYAFNRMPKKFSWMKYFSYKKLHKHYFDKGVIIPDEVLKEFESQPDYHFAKEIASELDKKQSLDNFFNDRLTDEEYSWRKFAEDVYEIKRPDYNRPPFDSKNEEWQKYYKKAQELDAHVFVIEPRTKRIICKRDVQEQMVLKYDLEPRRWYLQCNEEEKYSIEKMFDVALTNDDFASFRFNIASFLSDATDRTLINVWKKFKLTPFEHYSQDLNQIGSLNLKEPNIKLLDPKQKIEFALSNNLVGNLSNLARDKLSKIPEVEILQAYRDNQKKWNALAQHTKLYILTHLFDSPNQIVESDLLVLSSKKVNFTNGMPYYLCGRYGDVRGENESGKKTKTVIPFCLNNIEGLGNSEEKTTNLPLVRVYNMGKGRLAVVTDKIQPNYGSVYSRDFFSYLRHELVIPSFASFKNVVYLNEVDVTTPSVLTDGKFTIALPGFAVQKVILGKDTFEVSAGGPCESYNRHIYPTIEFKEELRSNNSFDRIKLPAKFDIKKAKILEALPIDQPGKYACNIC